MKSFVFFVLLLVLSFAVPTLALASPEQLDACKQKINSGWKFKLLDAAETDSGFQSVMLDDASWASVSLPHTAHVEPLVVNDQWQGICWYRKTIELPQEVVEKKLFVEFEGAMSQSRIWINGELVKERMGGYLPVVLDATEYFKPGEKNVVAVRLDNTDNPLTGPKPLKILDFNMYGGLYRNAWLTIKDKVYISHPVLAGKTAGGGVFITYPKVAADESIVKVKTHVINEDADKKVVEVVQSIYFEGKLVTERKSKPVEIASDGEAEFVEEIPVVSAKLWSPQSPSLYSMKTTVLVGGKLMDEQSERFGVREFEFKAHELYVNGKKTFLRGVNRHQEYPFVGYAFSDNAQYRDAKKIKEAGFNHIRLSHYPHSPAFMDACDELGLITLDAIMGWQYYLDDDRFRNYCYRSAIELIRRDRNRPSVLAWEVSLNESRMPVPFMEELHRITHAEYPGEKVYSSGWMNDVYDVFEQARQHRILHGYHENLAKPYFVSEYGDWEYYSNNAGLNQDKLDKTTRLEASSRQLREYGEKRLLKQAYNVQESHNDNLGTSAYGDAYWVMYDYNRGYHDEIESSGIMDIFRLPKFSYHFYQSQRETSAGAMVKIASYWTPESALDIKVYSNCDEVQLFLDDELVSSQKPDADKNCTHLGHPPFTFKIETFTSGTLKAVGLIAGTAVCEHAVKTPGKAAALKVWLDESGKMPTAGVNDTVFVYIAAVDENGTIVPDYSEAVAIQLNGDVTLLNVGEIKAEAGIATALVQIGDASDEISISASAIGLQNGKLIVELE
ncbi:Beta-galactosidase [Planctomycetes bacterium CA13]|uniref:Beta-galactosidase n=2 Tax=Novipirellula herctigrandis TaxID=2527986 RepID=A0A5C5ZAK1_9BACT|nr:Beta-galactosidase [Planctomycetes bacterium CA13]